MSGPQPGAGPLRLLFVCTGNICRSPAAAIAARAAAIEGGGLVHIGSAGTRAVIGSGVHPATAAALARRGLGAAGHVAQDISRTLIEQADLILTMSTQQRSEVLELTPTALGRCFTLREFVRLTSAPGLEYDTPKALIAAASRMRGMSLGDNDVLDPLSPASPGHDATVAMIVDLVDLLGRRLLDSAN